MKPELGPPDVEEIEYPARGPVVGGGVGSTSRRDRRRRRRCSATSPTRATRGRSSRRPTRRSGYGDVRAGVGVMRRRASSSPAASMGIGARVCAERAGRDGPARRRRRARRARRSRRRVAALAGDGHEALALDVGDAGGVGGARDRLARPRRRSCTAAGVLGPIGAVGDDRPARVPRRAADQPARHLLAVHHCLPALRAAGGADRRRSPAAARPARCRATTPTPPRRPRSCA